MIAFLFWLAVLVYGVSAGVVIHNYLRVQKQPSVLAWWLVVLGCVLLGGIFAHRVLAAGGMLIMDLATSLELVALVVGILYVIGWRLRRVETRSMGVLILPLIFILLVVSKLFPAGGEDLRYLYDPLLVTHLVLSLLAYGLFSMAFVLALLSSFQERALRAKRFDKFFDIMPPLDSIEEILFFCVGWGFILLTLSIISGAFFSKQQSGFYFQFSHKVVFSWVTWLLFGTLLLGRKLYGWRGRKAVRLTGFGYLCIVLAYFGVKFVTEVFLSK
ncbi:MAG: cytochrome c biogenesis protein CcsA [Magnetococcus sp. DMHC-6]